MGQTWRSRRSSPRCTGLRTRARGDHTDDHLTPSVRRSPSEGNAAPHWTVVPTGAFDRGDGRGWSARRSESWAFWSSAEDGPPELRRGGTATRCLGGAFAWGVERASSCHPITDSAEVHPPAGHGEDRTPPRRLGNGPHRGDTLLEPARDRDVPVLRRIQPCGHPFLSRNRRFRGGRRFRSRRHRLRSLLRLRRRSGTYCSSHLCRRRLRGLRCVGTWRETTSVNPPLGLLLAGSAVGTPHEEDIGLLIRARGLDLVGPGSFFGAPPPGRG